MAQARRLIHTPLAPWEREGLKSALVRAGLPADDVDDPHLLTWRFEHEDVPVGFGGLEIHWPDALLRSVVTLPPLRQIGMGSAIVDALEAEVGAHRCSTIYLLTTDPDFFGRLGYAPCARSDVPAAIQSSHQFTAVWPPTVGVMVKRL
jgi:N-acetylglutamate synthase-like GNAT family acetyltransferase